VIPRRIVYGYITHAACRDLRLALRGPAFLLSKTYTLSGGFAQVTLPAPLCAIESRQCRVEPRQCSFGLFALSSKS
jgi:hypothetical protein